MANLTAAELKGIEDGLNAEKLLILKYRNYAQMTADPTVRGLWKPRSVLQICMKKFLRCFTTTPDGI